MTPFMGMETVEKVTEGVCVISAVAGSYLRAGTAGSEHPGPR